MERLKKRRISDLDDAYYGWSSIEIHVEAKEYLDQRIRDN
jgi:hypothetical protein